MAIKGQVAEILNSREVVINRGAQDGVSMGMRFAILDPKAENIRDPETDEILGSIYRPKVEVRVVRVEKRLSIAKTFKATQRNIGGMGVGATGFGSLFDPPKYVKEYETFKSNQSTWEDLDESESYVKVGDPVEEVTVVEEEIIQA